MNTILPQFRQFKFIIIAVTFAAVIYTFNTSTLLVQPLLLFSTLLICVTNIIESLLTRSTGNFILLLHFISAILAGWGLKLSVDLINANSWIIEMGTFIH